MKKKTLRKQRTFNPSLAYPNKRQSGKLAEFWSVIFNDMSKTNYEFDRLILNFDGYIGAAFAYLWAPSDPQISNTPFEYYIETQNLDGVADEIESDKKQAKFITEVNNWFFQLVEISWRSRNVQSQFKKIVELPLGSFGIYRFDDIEQTTAGQQIWVCGDKIKAGLGEFLEKFVNKYFFIEPNYVFWCESGRVKDICLYSDCRSGNKFTGDFLHACGLLKRNGQVPNRIMISKSLEVSDDLISELRNLFSNRCKVTILSERQEERYFDRKNNLLLSMKDSDQWLTNEWSLLG